MGEHCIVAGVMAKPGLQRGRKGALTAAALSARERAALEALAGGASVRPGG